MKSLRATKTQRFFAYLIDFILLSLVTSAITSIIYMACKYDVDTKNSVLQDIEKEVINYINYVSVDESYDFTYLKSLIGEYFRYYSFEFGIEASIALVYCALYFVVLPKYWKNQTIGRLAMKVKVVDKDGNDPSWKNLILREIVGTFLLYIILNTFSLYTIMLASLLLTIYGGRSLVDYVGGTMLVSSIYFKEETPFENNNNSSDTIIDAEFKDVDSTNSSSNQYDDSDDYKTF